MTNKAAILWCCCSTSTGRLLDHNADNVEAANGIVSALSTGQGQVVYIDSTAEDCMSRRTTYSNTLSHVSSQV